MKSTEENGSTTVIKPQGAVRLLDLNEIAQYRDLAYFMVLREVTVLYKQTVLGFTWAILNPFVSMVVFSVIFGRLAAVPSDGVPYPIFSFAALVPWTYFSTSLTASSGSLLSYSGVFTKVYFPRIFIPLVPILAKLVDFSIACAVLAAMMLWYGVTPTLTALVLPILVLIMILTASGLGSWMSALGIKYRDVRHATGFVLQVLMYATPVVWPLSLVPEKYHTMLALYPMVGVIEGFRAALLHTKPMPWHLLGVSALGALLIFAFGITYFRRAERFFADVA